MAPRSVCRKCVLPSTTPGIEFDQSGVCNYCNSYLPMQVEGEERLRKVIDAFRDPSAKYDCMVCVSGGRDSTYTLWRLANDYKMKVLAAHYLLPFTSEQARANIQSAVDVLGIDCVNFEYPNDVHRRATRKALKAWSHRPSSRMIPIVCAHCKTWWPMAFQIARENNVSLIVIGSNPLETATFKRTGLGGARTYHKLANLPRIVGISLKEAFLNPRYLVSCSWSTVAKMYLMASHSSPYLRWRYKDLTVLRLFDYLKWDEKEVMSTIKDKLGWRNSSEVASPWRFDCRLDYVRRLMYTETIGVSELRDLFSKMIREGQMTREQALERLKTEEIVRREVVEDVLSHLGLGLSDLHLGSVKEQIPSSVV